MDIMKTPRSIGLLLSLPNIAMDATRSRRIFAKKPSLFTSAGGVGVSFIVVGFSRRSFSRSASDTPSLSQARLASSFRPLNASHLGDSERRKKAQNARHKAMADCNANGSRHDKEEGIRTVP